MSKEKKQSFIGGAANDPENRYCQDCGYALGR